MERGLKWTWRNKACCMTHDPHFTLGRPRLKARTAALKDFEWQGGYAVFSVSPSTLDRVRAHVADQERHHQRFDYQGELRALLRRHGLEWDERYLWD